MRVEGKDVMLAFLKNKKCKRKRTETDGETVWLHGNKIAWRLVDGSICMTLAGWNTVTTRDRLNTLVTLYRLTRTNAGDQWAGFRQANYEPYFGKTKLTDSRAVVRLHGRDFTVYDQHQPQLIAA